MKEFEKRLEEIADSIKALDWWDSRRLVKLEAEMSYVKNQTEYLRY